MFFGFGSIPAFLEDLLVVFFSRLVAAGRTHVQTDTLALHGASVRAK